MLLNVNYSALTEKLREILKLLSLKWMIESELQSIRIFLVNATLKIANLLPILLWKIILDLIELRFKRRKHNRNF